MKDLLEFKIIIDDDSIQEQKTRRIKGHVRVVIGETKISRKEIKVKYICKARTDWKEVKHKGTVHYKDMQILTKHRTILHHTNDTPLDPGEHNLHFEFNIGISALPPSFEGPYGKIWHRIKAVFRSSNILESAVKDEWIFRSSPIIDLNTHAEQLMQCVAVDKTIYGVLGRLAKPVRLVKATLDKSGYVPGEGIIVTVEMDNSTVFNHPLEANLRQVVRFIGKSLQSLNQTDKSTIANVLNTVSIPGIPASDAYDEMCCVVLPVLQIPPTPPSGLIGCTIISLGYDVMLSSKGFDVKMPIVIGNVPLHMASRGPVCPSGSNHVVGTTATHTTDTHMTDTHMTDMEEAVEPLDAKDPLPT